MMVHTILVDENVLDFWVRGNARDAQGVIVTLIHRLIRASDIKLKEFRFPMGDSIEQPGPDGVLSTDSGFEPFIPKGSSYWEIGTGKNPKEKATKDYCHLTKNIPHDIRASSTFVFVTPLSGRSTWPYTWTNNSQAQWVNEKREKKEWKDIRVIDATRLISWLSKFPSIEAWLAEKMNLGKINQVQTPEQHWLDLKTVVADPADPPAPPLIPQIFLENRDVACDEIKDVFYGPKSLLRLDTYFLDQVADFVSAYIATINDEDRLKFIGICLIIPDIEICNNMISQLEEPHILVLNFNLDEKSTIGLKVLKKSLALGHKVIYGGMPGGPALDYKYFPSRARASIPNPKPYQITECLKKAGYEDERARTLAQKSSGNLSYLVKYLNNIPLIPEWAQQRSDTPALVIATLLGEWDENNEHDKTVAEKLSNVAYDNWIEKIRNIATSPNTPLSIMNGKWKFNSRYEGWINLGSKIFDDQLERLKITAVNVLREKDPKFKLIPSERHAANVHGEILSHSSLLRKGVAETLALLGSYPEKLISCSLGKPEAIAVLSVREILDNADWMLWATLDNLLPLLAEAAPNEFLLAVEKALNTNPCPFEILFSQENSEFMGNNYMCGVIWALETLAWDPIYLTRVIVILGDLASRDPGGPWVNRPINSISTILLPWLPQNCATVEKRINAFKTLIREYPDIAWKALLSFLPNNKQVSYGSHRPMWRTFIPDSWTKNINTIEYWNQVERYTELTVQMVNNNISYLLELIPHLHTLIRPCFKEIIKTLNSLKDNTAISEIIKGQIWEALIRLVRRHRMFKNSNWAMKEKDLAVIEDIAKKLEPVDPILRYRNIFSDRFVDLFIDTVNYEDSVAKINTLRKEAIGKIITTKGLIDVISLASNVEAPQHVGIALGGYDGFDIDKYLFPKLINNNKRGIKQFVGGYIREKFRLIGWQWVSALDISKWTPAQIGHFLTYLPFMSETWQKVSAFLGDKVSLYWKNVSINPYEAKKDIAFAIDQLVAHGKSFEAIVCIYHAIKSKQNFDIQHAIIALRDIFKNQDKISNSHGYMILEIINFLQENLEKVNYEAIFEIEWAYLPLLNRTHKNIYPKILEQRLADDPDFFCEVINTFYLPKNESVANNAYQLLYHWKTPPGSKKDGTFIGKDLHLWVERVKTSCLKTDHFKVALYWVGHIFIHIPADPNGLWINHFAAQELNEKNSDYMRKGFTTALINSRGVYTFTSGKDEKKIAEKYKKQADEVENHGYHRLASSLREIAFYYEESAIHDSAKDIFD